MQLPPLTVQPQPPPAPLPTPSLPTPVTLLCTLNTAIFPTSQTSQLLHPFPCHLLNISAQVLTQPSHMVCRDPPPWLVYSLSLFLAPYTCPALLSFRSTFRALTTLSSETQLIISIPVLSRQPHNLQPLLHQGQRPEIPYNKTRAALQARGLGSPTAGTVGAQKSANRLGPGSSFAHK